jgi:NAD(P)-dependent dehydrogenase (short-subunit alcohol dehydrogenase family)
MKTNATGLFAITRAFGDAMAARGSGSIVNIGSIQGVVGPDYSLYEGLNMHAIPDYFFHKAGMVNLGRYFAALYGPRGVRSTSSSRTRACAAGSARSCSSPNSPNSTASSASRILGTARLSTPRRSTSPRCSRSPP